MERTKPDSFVVHTGNVDALEYCQNLINALLQVQRLIFTHRALDLDEQEIFALYMVNSFLVKLTETNEAL